MGWGWREVRRLHAAASAAASAAGLLCRLVDSALVDDDPSREPERKVDRRDPGEFAKRGTG